MRTWKYLALATILILMACKQPPQDTKVKSSIKVKVEKTNAEWKAQLTEQEYYVLREKGTERSFTGDLLKNEQKGDYVCAGCNNLLFKSETKFVSGTGWPSYYDYATDTSVVTIKDNSHGWNRVEVLCAKCDGHLGHVFEDGPQPTGLRYCINSVSLNFEPLAGK